jgi:signal transduction histidine kinase
VISLYDPEKQTRRPAYCWTDDREFDPVDLVEIPVGKGITGRAIKTGSVIIDNDFLKGLLTFENPVKIGDVPEDRWPCSALSAPMTVMGRTVGCVEVQSYDADAYLQEHATAMRMAANLAANAVENVTLIERERAKEEQFRQAQKMESIGTLAGGIAHDFNNLMTAVTGYSELTLRALPPEHAVRPKVEEIKKAGERAAALTRQLLAFSRKQMLQPTVLDLNGVVTSMGQMLPRVIGEDIDLRITLDKQLGQIKADRSQLEQVVLNLAVNARDAMPGGGALTISTENIVMTGDLSPRQTLSPGRYVMLSVSDSGCGMDAETKAHIFEPFYTTKEIGKGTGLGLSTVYGIVKQSGGTVWVYSEIGTGTTFKIYLPRVDEPTQIKQESISPTVPRGHETILLVEDEDVVRHLSQEVLEARGYHVMAAANGKEGLKICQDFKGTIHLVITDVIMPIMGGRELADRMSTLRPDTKVLYMSGFTDDAIVHHGVLEDGVFFIEKPFSPDSLAFKTREVLDYTVS